MDKEDVTADNPAFVPSKENLTTINCEEYPENADKYCDSAPNNVNDQPTVQRERWGNGVDFLMSCIALSVGLGNIWRFPFVALENGGGAFLIPYVIILLLVGKPIYYLEMVMGQFSSRGSATVYDCIPIVRGIGYGQSMAVYLVTTYYSSLMALNLRYLILSFYPTLPWGYCREEWGPECINSAGEHDEIEAAKGSIMKTSAEHYFYKVILHEAPNVDNGIGTPDFYLVLSLAFAWICIIAVVIRGIRSSGKVAYFLAIFPYVILLVLLVRSLTLPGAFDGVLYFLTPQWNKILDVSVWYAAVTQAFFSLTLCYGVIMTYASYNHFQYNIKRDCTIITTLDTFTSLLSGVVIFGVLGNLAHETGTTDIKSVVKGGPGLAFISYPDAIAKFSFLPQVFSALFFLMMFILGVGTNVGIFTSAMTVVSEMFPKIKRWLIVIVMGLTSFSIGLMYLTPGGQYMLNLIDFNAAFVAITLAIAELISIGWIYGVKNICRDIQFMLNIKTSIYYRLCWSIITPLFIVGIWVYSLADYEPLEYNGLQYPGYLYVIAWCISAICIGQLFIWGFVELYKRPEVKFGDRVRNVCKPRGKWGPLDSARLKLYQQSLDENDVADSVGVAKTGFWFKFYDNIFN